MNKKKFTLDDNSYQFWVPIIIVAIIIAFGIIVLEQVGPIAEYCKEHPNLTHYEIESGKIYNCSPNNDAPPWESGWGFQATN